MSWQPRRRVKVVVNGNIYLVEVEDLSASPLTVSVNGQSYQFEVAEEAVEAPAGASTVARTVVPAPSVARATVPLKAVPVPGATPDASCVVRSPMPGNIVDVAVQVGDHVTVGQTLCSLEAMKMKSAIRSPRDAVVARVAVATGQPVAHGDVLFVFA